MTKSTFIIALAFTACELAIGLAEPPRPTLRKRPASYAISRYRSALRFNQADGPSNVAAASSSKTENRESLLFDGKSLAGWRITKFGGEGEVHVKDGQLILEMGADLTGVTWKDAKTLPKSNYEVTLEAKRVDGTDFFCGLTFPVKDDPCSLILGGWGGGVCGLSSIDSFDASENDTTTYIPFESDRWYRIKLRVQDERIDAWIDDELIVEQEITGRKISIRPEVELSRPFGLASWQTTAALRNIKIRRLEPKKSAPDSEPTAATNDDN